MKTYISGIKVENVNPSYSQMIELAELFNTQKIENNGSLQINCLIKMQAYDARIKIRKILDCKTTDIRIKYHEK